jgi:hypothetical protein
MTADGPAIGNHENLIEDNNESLLFQAIEKTKIKLSSYAMNVRLYFQGAETWGKRSC